MNDDGSIPLQVLSTITQSNNNVFLQILLIRSFRKVMSNRGLLVIMGFRNRNDDVNLETLFKLYLVEALFCDFVRETLMVYAQEMRKKEEHLY